MRGSVDDYGDDYGGRVRSGIVIRSRRRSRRPFQEQSGEISKTNSGRHEVTASRSQTAEAKADAQNKRKQDVPNRMHDGECGGIDDGSIAGLGTGDG
jgi:hypothetical protein